MRYNPFDATISILGLLENRYKSFYMLGGRKKALVEAEKNVKKTFKTLRVVGRYVGYYKAPAEEGIIEAIRKSSPSLVLLCEGVKNKEMWPYINRQKFNTSIFMYYRDAIGIFGRRIKRVNPKTFQNGHEIWIEVIKNPLKMFLIFPNHFLPHFLNKFNIYVITIRAPMPRYTAKVTIILYFFR